LITNKFDQLLKAEKFKTLAKKEKKGSSLNLIQLSDEEYTIYLKKVYDFIAKDLPVPDQSKTRKDGEITKTKKDDNKSEITIDQMAEAIKSTIQITDDELKFLANERVLSVKTAILEKSNIDPKRIFIVEAETLEPEKADKEKESKTLDSASVIMSLK